MPRSYRTLLGCAHRWPHRVWAVEGADGAGRALAQRLVADGERVIDVLAKLAARVRLFDTGQGRKTDAVDAHSIAAVALRTPGLRVLHVEDAGLQMLRLRVDRRDELSRAQAISAHIPTIAITPELIPRGSVEWIAAVGADRPRDK